MTLDELAEQLGCELQTVQRHARCWGIHTRPNRILTAEEADRITDGIHTSRDRQREARAIRSLPYYVE